jgi:photosystem II stability/assembly factor-like uncharacterized protein
MKKPQMSVITVLSIVLMLFLCAIASADIQDMKLLTPNIGWVVTENNLYWTIDAGNTWKNITPPSASFENIAAVFFLNTSQGWVLCCDTSGKHKRFNIASTNDGGVHWSISPVLMPIALLAIENQQDAQKENQEDINKEKFLMAQVGLIL